MGPQSKIQVNPITKWAAIATMSGIIVQVLLYLFLAGTKLQALEREKAAREELYMVQMELARYKQEQALWRGTVDTEIKNLLMQKNNNNPRRSQ